MNAQIQAAAKAMADHNGWTSYTDAQKALAAADAVMFSDEAIERAKVSIQSNFVVDFEVGEYDATAVWGTPENIVSAVIAALKGDA